MIDADTIKDRLTAGEVVRRYGFEPNRSGYIQCPFHTGDKSPSLKVYPGSRGWHCFGCGEGGTVIDFVMKLFNLNFRQACVRIDVDFFGGPDTAQKPVKRRVPEPSLDDAYWAAKRIIVQENGDDAFWDALKRASDIEVRWMNERV